MRPMAADTSPTARQIDVLEAIDSWRRRNGHPPVIRELCEVLGVKSTNAVADHLRALARKGLTTSIRSKGRTLAITNAGRTWLRRGTREAA